MYCKVPKGKKMLHRARKWLLMHNEWKMAKVQLQMIWPARWPMDSSALNSDKSLF